VKYQKGLSVSLIDSALRMSVWTVEKIDSVLDYIPIHHWEIGFRMAKMVSRELKMAIWKE